MGKLLKALAFGAFVVTSYLVLLLLIGAVVHWSGDFYPVVLIGALFAITSFLFYTETED
jgi:hypothetical protein